mmetsp:Transcript_25999/g.71605  ORF Transcript_25999/g.71605 Transcript_25999/m.71605 type:complete len:396 (-) Transcript_25999:41-1228(-)
MVKKRRKRSHGQAQETDRATAPAPAQAAAGMDGMVTRDFLNQQFDVVNQGVDQKFKEMTAMVNQKFDGVNQKFDGMDQKFAEVNRELAEMNRELAAGNEKLDLLLSCNADATLERVKPKLETSRTARDQAVLKGGHSTWTYLQQTGQNNTPKLIAVGSVHCGLYYTTHHTENNYQLIFVNLPAGILEKGVEKVGFIDPGRISNPIKVHRDIMCVELSAASNTGAHNYNMFDISNGPTLPAKVGGKSLSGTVSGKHCTLVDGSHLMFVEDQGEAGNSGTLMFGWGEGSHPLPIGTYFGNAPKKDAIRFRGLIAPLPNYNDFVWYEPTQERVPQELLVQDKSGPRTCGFTDGSIGSNCRLEDGDEEWPGVLLHVNASGGPPPINYCGSIDVGSCRCK